ncbi:phospholipase D-like domain-containing protein [Arenibaculum pallidiluteum]|uniref:phospholipase D-like domain-containing protein n=1 Tax=Arenibaculum pallidiluteum TaxID=2812559 RepID=UPI001A9760CB|nr:phospholipase D-like domain-containing protein [Arenibaculum pallidiluteum]
MDLRVPDTRAAAGAGQPDRLLRPGDTCWRVETAPRVALLVDAERYFDALYEAMGRARHTIRIIGWDFDPRIRLRPDRPKGEGGETIEETFLRLLEANPDLSIQVLYWDMALPIAAQRPMVPLVVRDWLTPGRLAYRADSNHALGGTHHQKIVVIDDALAFCGGMDMAADRWDTDGHLDDDPRRVEPGGRPFEPHHDVMMMVDGAAAGALADLWRERWRRGTGEVLQPTPAGSDPWPPSVEPYLRDVPVAVARTEPGLPGYEEVREIERLHIEAILSAKRSIYIENQYFACTPVGLALARRLREPDGPEVLVVCPVHSPSYFDHAVMDPTRDRLIRHLRKNDRHGRFRALAPRTEGGGPIIVHSKVTIVDGRLLRIGSANLNNRSMGFDTECDLAIEAVGPDAEALSRRILAFRNRLIAEHLGLRPEVLAREIRRHGSMIAAVDALVRPKGRSLRPLATRELDTFARLLVDWAATDPYRSITAHLRRRQVNLPFGTTAAAAMLLVGGGLVLAAALGARRGAETPRGGRGHASRTPRGAARPVTREPQRQPARQPARHASEGPRRP